MTDSTTSSVIPVRKGNEDLVNAINSFWQILLPGLRITVPLTLISFAISLVQLYIIFYGLPGLGVTLDAFPSLCNSLIGLVKDTSLAANITVMEMFMSAQRIAARTYEPFTLYCEVGFIYLMFCTVLTRIQRIWESKLKLGA